MKDLTKLQKDNVPPSMQVDDLIIGDQIAKAGLSLCEPMLIMPVLSVVL